MGSFIWLASKFHRHNINAVIKWSKRAALFTTPFDIGTRSMFKRTHVKFGITIHCSYWVIISGSPRYDVLLCSGATYKKAAILKVCALKIEDFVALEHIWFKCTLRNVLVWAGKSSWRSISFCLDVLLRLTGFDGCDLRLERRLCWLNGQEKRISSRSRRYLSIGAW